MEYEWDEEKRAANLAKHGIDFDDITRFAWHRAQFDDDEYRTEYRERAVGFLEDRVVVVIFTLRSERCRIISIRAATPAERRRYERYWLRSR